MRPMSKEELQTRGEQLMRRADMMTRFREITSPYLGGLIATTDEVWYQSLITGGELYTDWADGHDARMGAAMRGIETTIEGAVNDPRADKCFINFMLGGLCVRYLKQGDVISAAITGANLLATIVRDRNINDDRQFALNHRLNPKAIPINKLKMDFQSVAVFALTTPYAKERPFRRNALGLLTAGTLVGIYGQKTFRKKLYSQLAERQKAN